ncbi:hypothetical protein QD460_31760, partial [Rhizobium jaguaris]|uniref:hypothetical protein n=1 Tax=Rhizobium jaguaris TaxID=1312183 RepID=UPI0039BF728F
SCIDCKIYTYHSTYLCQVKTFLRDASGELLMQQLQGLDEITVGAGIVVGLAALKSFGHQCLRSLSVGGANRR